jgi:hypothetical protein
MRRIDLLEVVVTCRKRKMLKIVDKEETLAARDRCARRATRETAHSRLEDTESAIYVATATSMR